MDTITTIAGSLPQLKITHTDTVTLPSTAIPVRRIETETDTDTISISATSTNPLERSVYEYEYENGRRYHAYRAGKYFLPNDEEEQERLNFAHHSWTLFLKGELHCVPLKSPKRVLDVGTGTGRWAIEMGDAYPDAEIIGVDLSPIQPTWVPPNVTFEVDDIEDEWTWGKNTFDFIHSRSMSGFLRDWNKYVQSIYDHLQPGGYLQILDIDMTGFHSDDGTYSKQGAVQTYFNHLNRSMMMMGTAHDIDELPALLRDTGFEDIVVRVAKYPIGTWPRKRELKERGVWGLEVSLQGFEAYSAAFTRVLRMSERERERLVEEACAEVRDMRIHSYWKVYVIIARKPLKT